MAVPSSGTLSLRSIRNEIYHDAYGSLPASVEDVSLASLTTGSAGAYPINANSSSRPNAIKPFAMSEFYSYDHDAAASFADAKAVSKSISTGTANMVQIANTGSSSIWNLTGTQAFTISFWVRAGWASNLNTNIHLLHLNQVGSTGTRNQQLRIYYNESNNRLYIERGQNNTNYVQQFWLFHSNSGNYATARAAANLYTSASGSGSASTYWSATNRGNVGDDNFTMITFTMSGTNSSAPAHLKCYWNASTLGTGFYASGRTIGNGGNMSSSTAREVAIGMNTANNLKSGNSAATLYNDLTVWNKTLSASEVSELYNSGTRLDATGHSAASNLKGYYTFEAGNGNDSSGEDEASFTISGSSAIATI